jgi:hypothetical protein
MDATNRVHRELAGIRSYRRKRIARLTGSL